jgi:hypothetical protein
LSPRHAALAKSRPADNERIAMTLSHHFKQLTPRGCGHSVFILVNQDTDQVEMETRDERKIRREIRKRGLKTPPEIKNRLQQWTVELEA